MTRRLTLPRAARLAAKEAVDRVFRGGAFVHGGRMTIGYRAGGPGPAHCAVIIPRARCPLSSARNRTRRLLRELFRLTRPELPAGYDIVVMPRRARGRDDYRAWADEWLALVEKAGLRRGGDA